MTMLTRPESSAGNSISEFTFAKAKPVQKMDFSRKPSSPKTEQRLGVPGVELIEAPTRDETCVKEGDGDGSKASKSDCDVHLDRRANATLLKVPVPMLAAEGSMLGQVVSKSVTASTVRPTIDSAAKDLHPPSDQPQPKPHAPGKARTRRDHATHLQGVRDEDVLRFLILRARQNESERGNYASLYEEQAAEARRLGQVNQNLTSEIENLKRELQTRKSSEEQERLTRVSLESRLKKFKDFLNGLSNDHDALRDESRQLRDRQNCLLAESQCLRTEIHDLQFLVERQQTTIQKAHDAHGQISLLAQSVQELTVRLEESQRRLNDERARNDLLHENGEAMASILDPLSGKISELHDSVRSIIDEITLC